MGLRGPFPVVAIAIILLLSGLTALASTAGPGPASTLPLGLGRVRTDKNCYLPGQEITITLKNVGKAPLIYSSTPDFEVENGTIGTVRMVRDWQMGGFHLDPGVSMSWTWDQKWRVWDSAGNLLHKGEYVPRGEYTVLAEALVGFPISDKVEIAHARFTVGDCLAQISAGDDIAATEGASFQFHPNIQITGDATITSVTWDVDPTVDSNGDGNFTNDIDLTGRTPTYTFGDDGAYPVTMNVRGFGRISGMDRVPQDTVFAIDSSTSMQWRDPIEYRKSSVKAYVDWLALPDRGAVLDFDSFARLVGGDHLGSDYAKIRSNVDAIDSSGDVFLAAGLLGSLYELRDYGDSSHKWIVIFLTGAETENPRDPFYIPRAIDLAKDLGVSIYTVGLSAIESESVRLLKKIASDTGGKYFSAATPDNLRKIFDDLATDPNSSNGAFFKVSDSLMVNVGNTPPTPSIDPAAELNVTTTAVLPASVTDPGTDDVTLSWNWGDGRTDARIAFNDGVGPDPFPSPWGLPVSYNVTGTHAYRLSGDYVVTLTATDDDGGSSSTSVTVHVSASEDLKRDAIQRIKGLKEQALARDDLAFLGDLNEAESDVWKSLGYTSPFRPDTVTTTPGADVFVSGTSHGGGDELGLALGPSWDSRLASYSTMNLTWANGVVTTIDLPAKWADKETELRARPWVDLWHQDVGIETERGHRKSGLTLELELRQASLDFSISLGGDNVANLAFTYEVRALWRDPTHLDPQMGHKVFDEERKAVRELLCGGGEEEGGSHADSQSLIRDASGEDRRARSGGDDDHEHDGCGEHEHGNHDQDGAPTAVIQCNGLDPGKWNDSETAALNAECDLIANLLVRADEMLALVAIQDAKDTPVRDPHRAGQVQHEIALAEKELARAYREWDEHEYDEAIGVFEHAWHHAELAIKLANK